MSTSAAANAGFHNALSAFVWRRKYAYAEERSLSDTWRRVAAAAASVETERAHWGSEFRQLLSGSGFLPAGRILAGAGTELNATLFNCFVMGPIDDSIAGIFERLRESALTMQLGGGIGCDFSTLRPKGMPARASGRTASGPVSFLKLWDAMCSTLLSSGNRRGAMMGVLRCDHPDILAFVDAKREPGTLSHFNLSVLVTNALLSAIDGDSALPLVFSPQQAGPKAPAEPAAASDERVVESIAATELWRRVMASAYDTAEPGVLFVDRINASNNLYYRERITATNPCGEVPLPPFGACNLGSINLAAHVVAPFSTRAELDLDGIGKRARCAVRFLDNIIDLSQFPLAAQAAEARATRRIGLGITGLADALIMLGHRYDAESGRELARRAMLRIRDEAYAASIALAQEKGCFPCFDQDAYLSANFISALPARLRDDIARRGIRNSHLLAIAPAGSISILADNVSSGIEPVFAPRTARMVHAGPGPGQRFEALDRACALWHETGARPGSLPPAFVAAHEISPQNHLLMASTLQALVDNSVSKTVNVAADIPREDFEGIYRRAFELGLKGCTVFRANAATGELLTAAEARQTVHCCIPEREGD